MNDSDDHNSTDLGTTAVVAADKRLPETYLHVLEGRYAGRRYRLHKARLLIGAAGRGARNDNSVDLETLSARHAAIELGTDGSLQLWDLESSNGSYINGEALAPGAPGAVKLGDEIKLGPDLLVTIERPGLRNLHPGSGELGSAPHRAPHARGQDADVTLRPDDPPGIRSDVPLGRILGYAVSGMVVLWVVLTFAIDFREVLDFVRGWFQG